jgi:hypothetical protein
VVRRVHSRPRQAPVDSQASSRVKRVRRDLRASPGQRKPEPAAAA